MSHSKYVLFTDIWIYHDVGPFHDHTQLQSDTSEIEGRCAANIARAHSTNSTCSTNMTASTLGRKLTPDSMEQSP
jgi:hypothetical protein